MITIIAKWIADGVTQIAKELSEAIICVGKLVAGIANMFSGEICKGFYEMRAGLFESIVALVKMIAQLAKMSADFLCIGCFCYCISDICLWCRILNGVENTDSVFLLLTTVVLSAFFNVVCIFLV